MTLSLPIDGMWVQRKVSKDAVEITASLATRDPREAKERQAHINAHLELVWSSLCEGPARLTHRQIVALAGKSYRVFAAAIEDNTGDPRTWEKVVADNQLARTGRFGIKSRLMIADPGEKLLASMEDRFGPIVDSLLAKEGISVDDHSRRRLLAETDKALTQAAYKLKRNAEGDYRPDEFGQSLSRMGATGMAVSATHG